MGKRPDIVIELSETLNLCWFPATNGAHGWWLWDETRGMNLAIRSATERDAFVEALEYYQKRLLGVEQELKDLKGKVDRFVECVRPSTDNDEE